MSNPYKRQEAKRSIRNIVLIVCEGKKTEPNYFRAFPTKEELISVEVYPGERCKSSLVEYAIELKKDAERNNKPYNTIWCVFDRDAYPCDPKDKNNFNKAIILAKKNEIYTAYSNDAFEIWYILHFSYHQTALHRSKYEKKLTALLGHTYEKSDPDMYKKLKSRQTDAIRNAKKLLASYEPFHNPETDNPCTTVHFLVEFLNRYLQN
jgi:hypothetical protein